MGLFEAERETILPGAEHETSLPLDVGNLIEAQLVIASLVGLFRAVASEQRMMRRRRNNQMS